MTKKVLKVVPNPFHQLDAAGMPATLPRLDPSVAPAGVIAWIGTTMKKEFVPEEANKPKRLDRERRRVHEIQHDVHTPVEVAATPFHISQVRSGETLAWDAQTASICDVKFCEVEKALAFSMAAAARKHEGESGEKAPMNEWEKLLKKPEPTAEPEPIKAAEPITWSPDAKVS